MIMQHVWSQIELATMMMCVCASTYRPLFVNWGNKTVEISKVSRASQYCQLQPRSEGLKYGMFNHVS